MEEKDMYHITFVFDSWHLNGVHCPNYRSSHICETAEEAVDSLLKQIRYYTLYATNGDKVDKDYILNEIHKSKYTSTSIFVTLDVPHKGREGYIIIDQSIEKPVEKSNASEREKILRLKELAEGMLMTANSALDKDATYNDWNYALLMCNQLDIK